MLLVLLLNVERKAEGKMGKAAVVKKLTKKGLDEIFEMFEKKRKKRPTKNERLSSKEYAKRKKAARQEAIDNAKVTYEDGVKVTRYPEVKEVTKKATGRPKGYVNPSMPALGDESNILYKKGGRVKGKCKVDGIAQRGRTRAKHK